ncbi:MAG: inositol monophosphatase [Hyphomicrobiales bacterium]|nr:MAG: inositol monophosphatase [Hyphomicrobiales bacterium]
MPSFLDTAIDISAKAAEIPRRYFRKTLAIDQKQDESPVTIADKETETYLRKHLKAAFPDHAIFGEEFGRESGNSAYEWVIDPIDGTRSFISGNPLYGMLLALLKDEKPILGLIRMPELGEVYTGDGTTAMMNGSQRLKTSAQTDLSQANIYINEGDKMQSAYPDLFARLCSTGALRRLAYDCYPHALVAAGHVDIVVDFDLQPYDYLPLVPIITGAGGVVSDWDGKPLSMTSDGRVISAATPELHQQILDVVNK